MQIGKVILDETWYKGIDLYSDGEIEDELLKIARTIPKEEYNREIARRKSWPVLYHFSHLRENILAWYPFQGTEQVLEIGSGCGAVTGALLGRTASVTALDLSMKRSQVNAWRNRDARNLKILVGNFEDIEPSLPSTYDVITLIGVFEYACGYIHAPDPYVEFLRRIAKHLAPGGRILMAIENRLGLKYWAGCTEDHTGQLFEGLEGYPSPQGVRTFSRRELASLVDRAGSLKADWYYPYPDYKLPSVLYSDRRRPLRGEVKGSEINYDRLRLDLFEEGLVYDGLLENGLYPEFANSFLLILHREDAPSPVTYARFSNERDPRFCVCTRILEWEEGQEKRRLVQKLPCQDQARAYVEELPVKERALSPLLEKAGLFPNQTLKRPASLPLPDTEGGIFLEYLEGHTLQEDLDALLDAGALEEVETLLLTWAGRIRKTCGGEPFRMSSDFRSVFGRASLPEGMDACSCCDIDLIPANLLPAGEGGKVLDYEWTFFFPIPTDYIVYRFLHYYMQGDSKRHPLLIRGLYGKAGISSELLPVFAAMERSLQAYLTGGHVPISSLYGEISPGKIKISSYYDRLRANTGPRVLQVFYDSGQGFCEEQSNRFLLEGGVMQIPLPAGTRMLRLDPGEAPGGLKVELLEWEEGRQARFYTNGFPLGDGGYYFGRPDPQLILEEIPEGAASLTLQITPLQEQEAQEKFWEGYSQHDQDREARIRQLEQEKALLTEQIRQMEGTKAWRLYQAVKKKKSRDHGKE